MSAISSLPSARGPSEATGRRALLWSWLALLAVPVAAWIGWWAAHVPYLLMGRDWDISYDEPLWFVGLVALISLGIAWIPVGVSLVLGVRALHDGVRAAWWVLVVDGLLTAFVVLAVLSDLVTAASGG